MAINSQNFFLQCSLFFPEVPITPKLEHLILVHSFWIFFCFPLCNFFLFFSSLPFPSLLFPICVSVWLVYIDICLSSFIHSLAVLKFTDKTITDILHLCYWPFNSLHFYLIHSYNSIFGWNCKSVIACCQNFQLEHLK